MAEQLMVKNHDGIISIARNRDEGWNATALKANDLANWTAMYTENDWRMGNR